MACSSNDGGGDTTDDDVTPVDRTPNLRPTGASANDMLSNANFDRLHIQIASVSGFSPTSQTLVNFEQFIRERTFKQQVDFTFLQLSAPDEESLELADIARLENENRTAYNDSTTVAIYIYFTNAPSAGDDEDEGLVTLGAVYQNTSMVIYERTIRRLAQVGGFSNTEVETATLNHEFGHLLGLVNLGTVPINDHEDTFIDGNGNVVGNNHCNEPGCLMRAELQLGQPMFAKQLWSHLKQHQAPEITPICSLSGNSVLRLLQSRTGKNGAVVPELGFECILDLQGNGGR